MSFSESYVRERVMEQYGWTDDDLEVLEALANDLWSGPSYILADDSEDTEDTVECYDPKSNSNKKVCIGGYYSSNIIGDFYPVGIAHVSRMFDDVRTVYVNTEYDDVFFGSENGLSDYLFKWEKECTSFEEWKAEYYEPTDDEDDDLDEMYESWCWNQTEYLWLYWQELGVRDILELFVSERIAREIIYHL
jgi:hypothetical protein